MIDLLEDGETYTIMQMHPTNKLYLQMTVESNSGSPTYFALNNNTKNTLTFTVDKSSNRSYSIVIQTNTIEVTGEIDITNYYQLLKGSYDEWQPFEKYTGGQPSPNPDYPQEITTLTFDKITRCGKNLFGGVELTKSTVGIDFTTYKDGSISAIGTATNQALSLYSADVSDYLRVLVPGTYTLSGGQDNIQVQVVQGDGTALAITPKSSPYTITFTLNETKKIFVRALIDNGVTVNTTIYPMLEQGSQATEYEPYQGQTYDIDLQGNEMVELRNGVKDELVIDKYGNVSLIKNVGKYFFDGSENWVSLPTTDTYWEFSITYETGQQANYTYSLSNYFSDKDYNRLICTKLEVYIRFPKNIGIDVSDVEKFKSWLQSHNTIAYYELTEPQTIPLGTLSELITTLNGTNNISINGNIPTSISATYALDIKKYIDNKLAEISAAMIEEG